MAIRTRSVEELAGILRRLHAETGKRVRILPVGPQGSGKSFLGAQLRERLDDFQVVSLDEARLELYQSSHPIEHADYRKLRGFLTSGKERAILKSALKTFHESTSTYVYLDQMNLLATTRAPFLQPENHNVAIVLDVDLPTILQRHHQRSDKAAEIPQGAVVASLHRLEPPSQKEFDLIVTYTSE